MAKAKIVKVVLRHRQCQASAKCPYDNDTKGPFCRNCTANMHSWEKRPAAHRLKYSDRLSFYADRMKRVT